MKVLVRVPEFDDVMKFLDPVQQRAIHNKIAAAFTFGIVIGLLLCGVAVLCGI